MTAKPVGPRSTSLIGRGFDSHHLHTMKNRGNLRIDLIARAIQNAAQVSHKIVETIFTQDTNKSNIICITDKLTFTLSNNIRNASITLRTVPLEYIRDRVLGKAQIFVSAVEDESAALILTKMLNTEIPVRKIQIELNKGDVVIVFKLLSNNIKTETTINEDIINGLHYEFLLMEIN